MPKVLIIATSPKTRGGITSVIKSHQKGDQWNTFHCKWIATHIDRNFIWKFIYLINGWLTYIILLPFYDIVHIHTSEPPSALRKCLFFPFAKLLRKKTIIHFHSFSPDSTIRGKYHRIYQYLFSHADKVVVLSQLWKKYVNDTFQLHDKVEIIYNPCIIIETNLKHTPQNYILYAGTINDRKGYADLIIAFSKIAKKHIDWNIVFAGNGEIEKGKQIAAELGISSQVEWLGWVDGEFKTNAFQNASIFCLPSYAEGFPMAVLDAWAYNLPVITTPVGGIPDIANEGENLMLFIPGDIESLATKLDLLISNKQLRIKISKGGYQLVNSIFNIQTINNKIEDLYLKLITNKKDDSNS